MTLNKLVAILNDDWKIEGFDFEEGLAKGAYRKDYQPCDFVSSKVPCTVRNALLKSGKIPDPYIGFNSNDSLWTEDKEWWFFKDFDTPERLSGQQVFLRFEGITYRAEIWVNGIQVGIIRGMFRTDEFDITDFLNVDKNRLTLRIRTQEHASKDNYDPGSLKRGIFSGVVRTQGPVAQCMSYWNWCQHMVEVGIWRPVKLLLKSNVEIKALHIRTLSVDLQDKDGYEAPRAPANIEVEWLIENHGKTNERIKIDYSISGETFDSRAIIGSLETNIEANESLTLVENLHIDDAFLWWPNGLGQPELYRIVSKAFLDDGTPLQRNDEIFGIRKYSFLKNESEEWVKQTSLHSARPWSMLGEMYKWTFVVNGRKVFLKGSNWVILDSMLRLERERYDRQLSVAKNGGFNFLRIWGGSLAETEEFYDLCNRYGIMCCQEFWLACGNYPAMDHELFLRCVRDTVRRLMNNPSLVYYCGGNEYEPDNKENKVLVDKIADLLAKEDSDREFRRGSPYKGDKHGGLVPTPMLTRNKYFDILPGDSRIVLFRSEVAVGRSSPVLSNFEKMIPLEKRWPLDDALWKHFFAIPSEFKMFANEYDALDELLPALFANWLSHARICQYNMEYCRSQMFKCSGNLNWQLNAPWPCMHREIIDMWGVPKPAFYFQKRASTPTAAILDFEKYLWNPGETLNPAIYIANDKKALEDARLIVEIFLTNGESVFRKEYLVNVPENAAVKIGCLDFEIPESLSRRTLFVTTHLSVQGKELHDNIYWIAVSNHFESPNALSLAGKWKRKDGSTVNLPGKNNDGKCVGYDVFTVGAAFDFEEGKSIEASMENMKKISGSYSRSFELPESLKGKKLEFFTPGFEASDEIRINGVKIGSHTMKSATFCHEQRAYVPFGKKTPDNNIDRMSEYPFISDPIIFPKLDARFYDIPEGLLFEGKNTIEIIIEPYYNNAVQFDMKIRERTPNREEVSKFLKKGIFYSDMRNMPKAKIEIFLDDGFIVLRNLSDCLAFCVIVEYIPDSSDLILPLDDNAFSILPHKEKRLKNLSNENIYGQGTVRLYGWNVTEKKMKLRNL